MDNSQKLVEQYPGYMAFLEASLEFEVIDRNINRMFNAYDEATFYEEEGDEKGDGILAKIGEAISAFAKKLVEVARSIIARIKSEKKEHVSVEMYAASSMGQADMDERFAEISGQIDRIAAEQKPLIRMLSNVSHLNPATVDSICSRIDAMAVNIPWQQLYDLGIRKATQAHLKKTEKYASDCEHLGTMVQEAMVAVQSLKCDNNEKKKKLRALEKVNRTNSRMLARIKRKEKTKDSKN